MPDLIGVSFCFKNCLIRFSQKSWGWRAQAVSWRFLIFVIECETKFRFDEKNLYRYRIWFGNTDMLAALFLLFADCHENCSCKWCTLEISTVNLLSVYFTRVKFIFLSCLPMSLVYWNFSGLALDTISSEDFLLFDCLCSFCLLLFDCSSGLSSDAAQWHVCLGLWQQFTLIKLLDVPTTVSTTSKRSLKENFSFPRNISYGNFFAFCIWLNIADCGNHSLSVFLMLSDVSSFKTIQLRLT